MWVCTSYCRDVLLWCVLGRGRRTTRGWLGERSSRRRGILAHSLFCGNPCSPYYVIGKSEGLKSSFVSDVTE